MIIQWSKVILVLILSSSCCARVVAFRPRHGSLFQKQLPRDLLKLRCGSDDLSTTPDDHGNDISPLDEGATKSDAASDDSVEAENPAPSPAKTVEGPSEEEEGESEEFLVDDPTIDEDSSANVDRMEYADAYDDEEENDFVDLDNSSSSTATLESDLTPEESSSKTEHEMVSKPSEPPGGSEVEHAAEDETEEVFEDALPTIQLQSQITQEMKQVMIKQLNYRSSDLKVIRPEIASIIVAKKLERPMEGIPQHWYKDESKSTTSALTDHLKKAALVALTCGIAFLARSNAQIAFSAVASVFQSSTRSSKTPSTPRLENDDPYANFLSTVATASVPETEEKETGGPHETVKPIEHEHSVRPGEKYPEEPLDETWLDKGITAVERQIKKLFSR